MLLPHLHMTGSLRSRTDDRAACTVVVAEMAKSLENGVMIEPHVEMPIWVRRDLSIVLRHAARAGLHVWSGSVARIADDRTRAWLQLNDHALENRRQAPRVVLDEPVELQRLSGTAPRIEVRSADLSETGIRLFARHHDLRADEQLMLCMRFPGGLVSTAGRVVGVHGAVVRIRFAAMHAVCQERIRAEVAAGLIAQQCDMARDADEALEAMRELVDQSEPA